MTTEPILLLLGLGLKEGSLLLTPALSSPPPLPLPPPLDLKLILDSGLDTGFDIDLDSDLNPAFAITLALALARDLDCDRVWDLARARGSASKLLSELDSDSWSPSTSRACLATKTY